MVEKRGKLIGSSLEKCEHTDKMVVCPYPVYENEHALCGFRATTDLNCTLEIRNLERDVTWVAYRGEGENCIPTSLGDYPYGAAICNTHNTTFCIKPHIPTRIGMIEMAGIHRREETLINASEEWRQSLKKLSKAILKNLIPG